MELQKWLSGLVVFASVLPSAEAMNMYDPQLCYILDGFLGLYGLIITGMFIKEKFFKTKVKVTDENPYSSLSGPESGGYAPLNIDPERGRGHRRTEDSTYTDLQKRPGDEYRELPVKREQRQRKKDQIYQGLSSASRDTYDELQMQPLPPR